MSLPALFTDPVIAGFFPDPTVCFDGEFYYLANSSFEYFPAAPLWRSRDAVSWRFVGNILTRRSQFAVGDGRRSGGIFGSTLRFHDGRFWFITTNMSDFGRGHTIVSASDPAGEWSDPVFVTGAIGIDPDLSWTDDGRCLLTWCGFGFGEGSAIVQAELDLETGALLTEPIVLWGGTGLAYTEGPHLIRRGDVWYLVVAEGGTASGHVVSIARSASPSGPFESHPNNPIVSQRSLPTSTQNIGHADLVEGPGGEWFAVLLGVRTAGISPSFHILGRETFAARVAWVDEWPVFEPIHPEAELSSFVDRFVGPGPGPEWVSPAGDPESISRITPHGLEVRARRAGSAASICTRIRDISWDALLEVDPRASASFAVRLDDDHIYRIEAAAGRVRVTARIGPVEQNLGEMDAADDTRPMLLSISSRPHAAAGSLGGNAGPDEIHLGVLGDPRAGRLAALDGRYLSTEVAGGFTGRVLCIEACAETSFVRGFTYRGVSASTPLPEEVWSDR